MPDDTTIADLATTTSDVSQTENTAPSQEVNVSTPVQTTEQPVEQSTPSNTTTNEDKETIERLNRRIAELESTNRKEETSVQPEDKTADKAPKPTHFWFRPWFKD